MKAIFLLALVSLAAADTWAVVISGSSSYSNYRHQSNAAHQWHMFRDAGVAEDHIIVFSYGDVINHKNNPFPGELYNLPGDSENFAKDLKVDYEGKDITKKNVFGALLGDKEATGGKKVLESTEEDNVFVVYYDHGSVGLIACCDDGYIYRDELQEVLKQMKEKKMFKKMVFYLEACDSATMMENFPDDLDIYVVTSTDSAVSGYACFCPPQDIVHDVHIGACLSEEFGYAFMKNMDETKGQLTWDQQFEAIYESMKRSHPKQWADTEIRPKTVADFWNYPKTYLRRAVAKSEEPTSFWDTRDNELLYLSNQLARSDLSAEARKEFQEQYDAEMALRQQTDAYFRRLISANHGEKNMHDMYNEVTSIQNYECYTNSIARIHDFVPVSDYVLKYFKVVANLCAEANASSINLRV